MYILRMCVYIHIINRYIDRQIDRVLQMCLCLSQGVFLFVYLESKCPCHKNSFICLYRGEVQDVLQSLWTQLFSETVSPLLLHRGCTLSFIRTRFKCQCRLSRFVGTPKSHGMNGTRINMRIPESWVQHVLTSFLFSGGRRGVSCFRLFFSNNLHFTCIESL